MTLALATIHQPTALSLAAQENAKLLKVQTALSAMTPLDQVAIDLYFNNSLVKGQGLGDDRISISPTQGATVPVSDIYVPHILSGCVDTSRLSVNPLGGLQGILGLGRTPIALPTQLSTTYKLPLKFALCLPSSVERGYGDLFIGGGPYLMPPFTEDVSKLLLKTPLVVNHVNKHKKGDPSHEYFTGVKSMKLDRHVVNFNASLLSIDKNGVGEPNYVP
ncbi:basic 7S globulin-like [Quillaja saponaria]|uniref:Basic 7S globulin-like n=1 Tax=Quillaja saponaria TaxID=32244 RepID=A0AAD7LBU1_QUISA|nr:basic 7S globulin-like [Quillaja saponaria]